MLSQAVEDYLKAIYKLQGDGAASTSDIAKAMKVHPKTVQRRLEKEKTTYKEIVQKVRKRTAVRLLTQTAIPNSNVAVLCGYSNAGVFNNAFKNWYGCTPGEYRKGKRATDTNSDAGG